MPENGVAELILASRSPRRRELLAQIGVRFSLIDVEIDETRKKDESPASVVKRLALEKMRAGRAATKVPLPVLGADTIVLIESDVLGKPESAEEAAAMLRRLSGREHKVISAVAVGGDSMEKVMLSHTRVTFRSISEDECQRYVATGEPMDKAGAYGIQGFGGLLVEKIEGSYSNVVGLPLYETAQLLQQAGVTVWNPSA